MSYLHRRLRQPKTPKWALITPNHITREQAEQIKDLWTAACRQPNRPIVLASGFEIKRLR
jgi:hypothetical protein